MQFPFTRTLIQALKFEEIPSAVDSRGRITASMPNSKRKPYIIFDANPDAPTGFAIRIGAQSKVFLVQVRANGRVVKSTVGRYPELLIGTPIAERDARSVAAELVFTLRKGVDVNRDRKLGRSSAVPTLDEALEAYIEEYKARPKSTPSKQSLHHFEQARRYFRPEGRIRLDQLRADDMKLAFLRIAGPTAPKKISAAEQAMAIANVAIKRAVIRERRAARDEKRAPRFENQVTALHEDEPQLFRTKGERERDREKRRRPIANSHERLGAWLEALWQLRKRKQLRTGADYMLCTLLFGARRSETSKLQWAHLLSDSERDNASIVDLERRVVIFRYTKNKRDHDLPLAPAAYAILKARKEAVLDAKRPKLGPRAARGTSYVFPAHNIAINHDAYYKCSTHVESLITQDTGVLFKLHDLRRTFASVVNSLGFSTIVVARLLNHTPPGMTGRYVRMSVDELRLHMRRIELELLKHASFATANKNRIRLFGL